MAARNANVLDDIDSTGAVFAHVVDASEQSDQAAGTRHAWEVWADDATTGTNLLTAEVVSNAVAWYSTTAFPWSIGSATYPVDTLYTAITATQVVYAGTNGVLSGDPGLTFNASTNTFTLGTNHIYSQGAHGLTLAADDWAVGSSSTNYAQWDNDVQTLFLSGITPLLHIIDRTAANREWILDESGGRWRLTTTNSDNEFWIANGVGVSNNAGLTNVNAGGRIIGTSAASWLIQNASNVTYATFTANATVGLTSLALLGFENLGTTIQATAQGDFAAGLNAGNETLYDQSITGGTWYMRVSSTNVVRLAASGNNSRPLLDMGPTTDIDEFSLVNLGYWRLGTTTTVAMRFGFNQDDRLALNSGETVHNDAGSDIDARWEGDTNANLVVVDAGRDAIGFGAVARSDSLAYFFKSWTVTSGTRNGVFIDMDSAGLAANSTAVLYGLTAQAKHSTAFNLGNLRGFQINAQTASGFSAGTLGDLMGGFVNMAHAGAGAVTAAYGLHFAQSITGAGTVGTWTQIHLEDLTGGTVSARIGIRQRGINAHNRFQGGATFGADATMTNTATVDVQGSLGVGAHGTTLSTSDFCAGSGTSSKMFYDDSALTLEGHGTGATAFWRLSSLAGTPNVLNESGAAQDTRIEGDTLAYMLFLNGSDAAAENVALVTTAEPAWNSLDRGLFLGDATTAPTGNPTAGGYLWSEAGALKWRGSSGTITTLAAA